MNPKRQRCPVCQYPQVVCLCHAITTVHSRHQIVILQHPSETKHAKGTARLLDLSMPQVTIHIGENETDFAELKQQLLDQTQPCYLLYPGERSHRVESMASDCKPLTLILLDGSWKKAYKLLQLNPWLATLPQLSFDKPQASNYRIRKAPRSDSLSTLEAVAHCLECIDDCDTQPLYQVLEAMIDTQWRFMDEQIKKRY